MKTAVAAPLLIGLLIATGCSRKPNQDTGENGVSQKTTPDEKKGEPQQPTKNRRGTFTIGKQTTYVTGPVDKNGHIDYAEALNERLSKGVTPENNSCVLIWKALGPNPGATAVQPGFFEKLGILTPPARGDYFVRSEQHNVSPEALNRCSQRSWKANQEPNLTAWLKGNEKPLALVAQGATRSHYYHPYVTSRNEMGSTGLFNMSWPGLEAYREIAGALASRAMLRAGMGEPDAAWQDLLTCHRLARLAMRGGTLIETLVGYAIEFVAIRAELAFLDHTRPDAKRLERYLRDLSALIPPADVAEKVEVGERFWALDSVMVLNRQGFAPHMAVFSEQLRPFGLTEELLIGVDWDTVLDNSNRWIDRIVAAYREKSRAARVRKLDEIETELRALRARQLGAAGRTLRDPKQTSRAKGHVLGEVLVSCYEPMWRQVEDAADRRSQLFANGTLAFALAWYHRDNGRYPDKLEVLAPKYLKSIPHDLFSEKPLIYKPSASGYLLYSVGVNGADDGGRAQNDNTPGDDIVVRMPLPSSK